MAWCLPKLHQAHSQYLLQHATTAADTHPIKCTGLQTALTSRRQLALLCCVDWAHRAHSGYLYNVARYVGWAYSQHYTPGLTPKLHQVNCHYLCTVTVPATLTWCTTSPTCLSNFRLHEWSTHSRRKPMQLRTVY